MSDKIKYQYDLSSGEFQFQKSTERKTITVCDFVSQRVFKTLVDPTKLKSLTDIILLQKKPNVGFYLLTKTIIW